MELASTIISRKEIVIEEENGKVCVNRAAEQGIGDSSNWDAQIYVGFRLPVFALLLYKKCPDMI